MKLAAAAGGIFLLCVSADRSFGADEPGVLVVTAFDSQNPAVGKLAMAVLHLQIWRTLREPLGGGPKKTVFWHDSVIPHSHAEARHVAEEDDVPMTLWGQAWDYKPGLAIQAYLTIRGDDPTTVHSSPVWRLAVPGQKDLALALPSWRYSFTPLVVSGAATSTAGLFTAIPIYQDKNSEKVVGTLSDSFQALEQDDNWAKVKANGKIGWVHLPGFGGPRSEIAAFVGGLIRLRRGDWPGVDALLKPLTTNPAVNTNVRAHAFLLMAAAAAQSPSGQSQRAIDLTASARQIAPFDSAALKYACMAQLTTYVRTGDRVHLVAARNLLATDGDLIEPGDRWVDQFRKAVDALDERLVANAASSKARWPPVVAPAEKKASAAKAAREDVGF